MKLDKEELLLYLVTDRRWLGESRLEEVVELTIKNGVTFVQLREKKLDYDSFEEIAISVKKVTDKHDIPFVINDNIELAKQIDADGVHIGQEDMSVSEARSIICDDKILGVSARNIEEALSAQKDGADYLGIGSVFETSSKLDALSMDFKELKNIRKAISIPIVAIGGINYDNIHLLKDINIDGVSVVSAILNKKDIAKSSKQLKRLAKKYLGGK